MELYDYMSTSSQSDTNAGHQMTFQMFRYGKCGVDSYHCRLADGDCGYLHDWQKMYYYGELGLCPARCHRSTLSLGNNQNPPISPTQNTALLVTNSYIRAFCLPPQIAPSLTTDAGRKSRHIHILL